MIQDRRPDRLARRIARALPRPVKNPLRWIRDRITVQGRMRRWLEQTHGTALLQPATVTWHDRHPELFALIRDKLAGATNPRILSYGCSTGEEVFTLAQYLPNAQIDGVDINPRSIAIAQRAVTQEDRDRLHFSCSPTPPQAAESFDAICCFSVLRQGRLDHEKPDDCNEILPFSRFLAVIEALDHVLKPGGLLLLWGSNFRFSDATIARKYRPLPTPGQPVQPGVFYGPDNARLAIDAVDEFVFEKRI